MQGTTQLILNAKSYQSEVMVHQFVRRIVRQVMMSVKRALFCGVSLSEEFAPPPAAPSPPELQLQRLHSGSSLRGLNAEGPASLWWCDKDEALRLVREGADVLTNTRAELCKALALLDAQVCHQSLISPAKEP